MNVLLVEDDPEVGGFVAAELRAAGHACVHKTDGEDALLEARNAVYDVLVIDRMLPRMDGLTLIKILRDGGSNTPMLVLSALGEVDDRVQGLKCGADDYLVKPFSPEDLVHSLNRILSQVSHNVKFMKILIQTDSPLKIERVEQQMQGYGYRTDLSIIPEEENIIEQTLVLQPDIVIFNVEEPSLFLIIPDQVHISLKVFVVIRDDLIYRFCMLCKLRHCCPG